MILRLLAVSFWNEQEPPNVSQFGGGERRICFFCFQFDHVTATRNATAANPCGVFVIRSFEVHPVRSILRAALLAALPIEIVNFWIVGYPTARGSLTLATQSAFLALEWDLLHLPGLISIDRIQFLRERVHASSVAFFLAGYIDTAILIAALIHTLRKLSSPVKQAL
jgi:hypothetical protein